MVGINTKNLIAVIEEEKASEKNIIFEINNLINFAFVYIKKINSAAFILYSIVVKMLYGQDNLCNLVTFFQ